MATPVQTRVSSLKLGTAVFAALLAGGIGAAWLIAGPLSPPAGPVASTFKTLVEVEPRIAVNTVNTPGTTTTLFRINLPGSYYLTGDITGVAGKRGIEITASGVTLDLNGFDVVGVVGSQHGILATGLIDNVTVCNGSIRNWGSDGLNLAVLGARVESVMVIGNGGIGIKGGNSSLVIDCIANENGSHGISGIDQCVFRRCSARSNVGSGIAAANDSMLTECSAASNSITGIVTGTSSVVQGCVVNSNLSHGISVGTASSVLDCASKSNTLDCIRCASGCTIRGNTCRDSVSGAGVHATGTDNRIEANTCSSGSRGIEADTGGNLIVRNGCASNGTNYLLAAGNVYGNIVDRTAPGSPAVSGNSAPATTATSDPNANFSY